MKKFECPFCKNESTKVYSKDKRFAVSAGVVLRYRRCECCGSRFITKDDTKREVLFRTVLKTSELLKEV